MSYYVFENDLGNVVDTSFTSAVKEKQASEDQAREEYVRNRLEFCNWWCLVAKIVMRRIMTIFP